MGEFEAYKHVDRWFTVDSLEPYNTSMNLVIQ